jgi:hypothetical protein
VWDSISNTIRKQIANSEYSYVRNRDLLEFDFTSASICLSKAIEIWLEDTIAGPLMTIPEVRPLLKNSSGDPISAHDATIGNISYFLSRVGRGIGKGWLRNEVAKLFPYIHPHDIEELRSELTTIALGYRNEWAHREPMARAVYEEFRCKACEFFIRWVPRWKKGKRIS